MAESVTVTSDLLAEPWEDVIDPPFGEVLRVGLVAPADGPPGVALLVQLEDGHHVVAMIGLDLYVKSSTAVMRAAVGKPLT